MVKEVNKRDPRPVFKAHPGWARRFMARFNLVFRRRTNKKNRSLRDLAPRMLRFLNELRQMRVESKEVDAKFGKFGLYNTLNADQVPLAFANDDPVTIDFEGADRVWIRQAGSGLDKRQATLQLVIRPMGKQMPPCLLFKGSPTLSGKPLQKRNAEIACYPEGMRKHVFWQKKAWMDMKTNSAWTKSALKEFRDDEINDADCLFLCDNLNSQTTDSFEKELRDECRATLQLGPPNATHLWQPVDQHIGRLYQRLMANSYDEWMASGEAGKYFVIGGPKLSAGVRRILLTHWAWSAYLKLEQIREKAEIEGRKSVFYRAFERSGCLITANGEDEVYIDVINEIKEKVGNFKLMTPQEAEVREEFVIPVGDDSDSANSEGEETGDDVEDGDAGVDGEEAKQSEEEQKYDEVVEDGDLEPGQIEAAIQEEGAGGLRDWEQKAPGPRPVPFVLDDFLNSVGLGTDSVHDKEGDMKQKEFLDTMLEKFRKDNPGVKWPRPKDYEAMQATAAAATLPSRDGRAGRRGRIRAGMVD